MDLVVRYGAPRTAGHNQTITGLECVLGNPLLTEPIRVAPLGRVPPHRAATVGRLDVHPGVWITVGELHHGAVDRDRLIFEILPRERVMSVGGNRGNESGKRQ